MLEFEKYAADPNNEAAIKRLGWYQGATFALDVVAITLAFVSMVAMLVTTRPTMSGTTVMVGYTWHVFAMFLGAVLVVKVGGVKILRWIIRSGLKDGSILRLDQTVIRYWNEESRKGGEPVTDDDRYYLQMEVNNLAGIRFDSTPIAP